MSGARRFWLLLLGLLAGCAGQDRPGTCTLEQRAELAITPRDNRPLVTVAVDGRPLELLLDTGAESSVLAEAAVERLGLVQDYTQLHYSTGVGGAAYGRGVRVRLGLGALVLRDREMAVARPYFQARDGRVPDGLLGNDVLGDFDVEIDLPRSRLALYAPRRCADAVPPWREPWIELPRPDALPAHNEVYFTAELDGATLVAMLDTGAQATLLGLYAALALGVRQAELDQDRRVSLNGIAARDSGGRLHRFGRLRLGGQEIASPLLVVGDLPPSVGDMLVGIGFLRQRKAWISYARHRLFVTAPPASR